MQLKNQITIYPNPNDGNFIIHLGRKINEDLDFKLYNNLGELVYKKILIANQDLEYQINLEKFNKGFYFIRISGSEKLMFTEKVIFR